MLLTQKYLLGIHPPKIIIIMLLVKMANKGSRKGTFFLDCKNELLMLNFFFRSNRVQPTRSSRSQVQYTRVDVFFFFWANTK
jgi:hypothetical protein